MTAPTSCSTCTRPRPLLRHHHLGGEADEGLAAGVAPKLKDDQQAIGAELAVIVTAAMPRDGSGRSGEPFMREADVWIVRFDAARPLAEALLRDAPGAPQSPSGQPRRAEKMELVYNYICSPQFTQR